MGITTVLQMAITMVLDNMIYLKLPQKDLWMTKGDGRKVVRPYIRILNRWITILGIWIHIYSNSSLRDSQRIGYLVGKVNKLM